MSKTIYTFNTSYTFTFQLSSTEWAPWFDDEPQLTKDPVLGGTTSYIDIGASVPMPLERRAEFSSKSARDAFVTACLLITATLSNTRGRSASAMLVKARRIDSPPLYLADLTFEKR